MGATAAATNGLGSNQYQTRPGMPSLVANVNRAAIVDGVDQIAMFDVPPEAFFDPEERTALSDRSVPEADRPLLRKVFKRVSYDTAGLWMRLREGLPLEAAQAMYDRGWTTLDEMAFLANFEGGVPRFDGIADGWTEARRIRDCARLRVGWLGPGDHTIESSTAEYAVLDFETDGLNPYTDRVVEAAITRINGKGRVLDRWSTLINPERPIPEGLSAAVHGISDKDVVDAPVWAEVDSEIRDRIDGAVLVAHNVTFEEHFLAGEGARLGRSFGDIAALDTKRLAGKVWGLQKRNLGAVCGHLGITNPAAHRAQGDTDTTAMVLRAAIVEAHRQGDHTFGFRIPAPTTLIR